MDARRSGRAILQSGSGHNADDTSCPRAVSKIINVQHAAPRIVGLALLPSQFGGPVHSVRPHQVRDEMNTIMRCIWPFLVFVLSTLADILARAARSKANSQSSHLYANSSCKDVLRVFTVVYHPPDGFLLLAEGR